MPGARKENKTDKPPVKDSRFSMWFYYSLLSGSLLMVGGLVGTRYLRSPHSSAWSLLFVTTSVTGIYLTLSSIHRFYNSLRDSVSEEAGNVDSPSEASASLENVDKNIKKNPLQITECRQSDISEDDVVKHASEDNAVVKHEMLSNVVTDIYSSFAENNDIIDDLSNLRSSSYDIVFKSESTKHILDEVITEDCKITQNIVAGDIKDAQVVASNAHEEEINKKAETEEVKAKNINIGDSLTNDDACKLLKGVRRNVSNEDEIMKVFEIEEMTAKNIICENIVKKDIISESNPIENINTSESIEENVKEADIGETIPMDNGTKFLVAMDCVTECKLDNQVASNEFLEDYNIKADIEEVIPKYIGIEEAIPKDIGIEEVIPKDIGIGYITDNVKNEKLDNDLMENEFIEEDILKEVKMENVLDTDISIKNSVTDVNVTESELDKNVTTTLEEDIVKESNSEVVTEKHVIIDDPLADDSKLSIEKDIKESEIEETTKNITIKFPVTEDFITESNVNVIANKFVSEYNTNRADIEKVIAKDISIEKKVTSDNVIEEKLHKDIVLNEIIEEDSITKDEDQKVIEKDITIKNPVVKDDLTESKLDKDAITTREDDMVKGAKVEEIEVKYETIEDPLTKNDENKHKLNKDTQDNVSNEDTKEDKIEDITAKNIYEISVAEDNVNDNSIDKIYQNKSNEKDIKIEEATSMHVSIGNLSTEKDNTQRKSGKDIQTNEYLEEYITKEAEIEVIQKDIIIEDPSTEDVTDDKFNKDDLANEIFQENFLKEDRNEEVASKDLGTNEICKSNLAEIIVVNEPLEEGNIITEAEIEEVTAKYISIEDTVVKYRVEDTLSEDDPEEGNLAEGIFNQNVVDIEKNTEIKEIAACEINRPYLPVGKTIPTKDPESQIEGKAITDEQNVIRALPKDCVTKRSTTVSQSEQYPKPSESTVATPIKQLVCTLTDEIGFLSPNTASGIGVFFRKSTRTRLAAQFPDIAIEPAKDSKYSPSKQSANTSVSNFLSTDQSLSTSCSVVSKSVQLSQESLDSTIELCSGRQTNTTDDNSSIAEYSPTTTNAAILASNRHSFTIDLDPNYHQSSETSKCSIVSLKDKTSNADIATGYSSRYSGSVVSLDQQIPKTERGVLVPSSLPNDVRQDIILSIQSPGLLDSAFISSIDESLGLLDTATISVINSSPVVSDKSVSNPIQFQKSSENTAVSPSGHLPTDFSSPSCNSSRQASKMPDRSVASLAGHSPRLPTGVPFSRDRHSPRLENVDNCFRRNLWPSVGGVEHIRRASLNSSASNFGHSRLSFGRGITTHSVPSAGASEEDIFSRAVDSPWASCDNISHAGHSTKSSGKDVFSLARHSPWSSCGDVSFHARRSKKTKDSDVFSHAHHSPWVSGSGTIFPAGQSRKPMGGRPFANPRHSRRASGGSGVPRDRHSPSLSGDALPVERSPSVPGSFTSFSGQSYSASVNRYSQNLSGSITLPTGESLRHPESFTLPSGQCSTPSVNAVSPTGQSTRDSAAVPSSDRQSPNVSVSTQSLMSEEPSSQISWSSNVSLPRPKPSSSEEDSI